MDFPDFVDFMSSSSSPNIPTSFFRLPSEAGTEYEQLDLLLFSKPIRHRLGQLLEGAEGTHHRREAARWMTEQNIADPDRFADTLIPGCTAT